MHPSGGCSYPLGGAHQADPDVCGKTPRAISLRNRKLLKTKWLHFNHFSSYKSFTQKFVCWFIEEPLSRAFREAVNSWGAVDLPGQSTKSDAHSKAGRMPWTFRHSIVASALSQPL